jgi:shikimate kinase
MATLDERLSAAEAKADELQEAVDQSQERERLQDEKDKATIADLTAQRDALQAIIDAGELTSAQEAKINGVINKMANTITDISTTPQPVAKKRR